MPKTVISRVTTVTAAGQETSGARAARGGTTDGRGWRACALTDRAQGTGATRRAQGSPTARRADGQAPSGAGLGPGP
eukprot:5265786-Alexandrium_andersonii.AAC.1